MKKLLQINKSPAIGAGDPGYAPADDILGRTRSTTPAVGAYEGQLQLSGHGELTTINLWWSTPAVPGAVEYAIHYRPQGGQESTINVPLATVEHQLTGLLSYTLYDVRLDVLNGLGQILARSNQLRLLTTDLHNFLPLIFSAAY